MHLLSIGIVVLFLTVVVIVILLMIFRLTGWSKRNYSIYSDLDKISFSGHEHLIKDFAIRHKPIIYQSRNLRGPVPKMMYYEALKKLSQDRNMTIIYRVYWSDEIHPNGLIDKIYRLFRWCYYGSKIDLEYIRILVNDSVISEIQFESDSSGKPDNAISDHMVVNLKRKKHIEKDKWVMKTAKDEERVIQITFEYTTHFQIKVLSWNHVFTIDKDISSCERYDLPLENLTDKNYRKWKIKRRSG